MTAAQAKHDRDSRLWTADQFLEFYMTRPDEERWQLVDGLAIMMVPPSFLHQKIAKQFFRRLDSAIERHRPDLSAYWEMGVRIPGIDNFNPMPDAVVVRSDAEFERYAKRFFLAAEVISPSNTAEMIERKLELYCSHPDNLYCVTLDQARSVSAFMRAKKAGPVRT